jgi:hypothetical protein
MHVHVGTSQALTKEFSMLLDLSVMYMVKYKFNEYTDFIQNIPVMERNMLHIILSISRRSIYFWFYC